MKNSRTDALFECRSPADAAGRVSNRATFSAWNTERWEDRRPWTFTVILISEYFGNTSKVQGLSVQDLPRQQLDKPAWLDAPDG